MTGYSQALNYLFSLEKSGIVFGLDNVKWILNLMGNPHASLKTIHIGGTNGKGSVATMLSHVLKEGGYRVGKYTSPHLVSFTERITINEVEITQEEVAILTQTIKGRVEEEDRDRFFTFFDFTTALAFEYFRKKEVDISIIEVGLGGRLDSTNVVEPIASIITNVSYDHMDYLGEDIGNIAREKAGIIKNNTPVITGAEGIPGQIIEETAKHHHSPLYALHRDFSYEKKGDQVMSYRGLGKNIDDLAINLMGDHQFGNAAIALCAGELLSSSRFPVAEESIREAFHRITWQGRLEKVHENPTIILDGAHNPDGAHTLAEFLKSHYRDKKKVLIFGVMKDKDYREILETVAPFIDTVILTKPSIDRALPPRDLEGFVKNPVLTEDVRSALIKARTIAARKDLILITGSFYTIGEAKQIINDVF